MARPSGGVNGLRGWKKRVARGSRGEGPMRWFYRLAAIVTVFTVFAVPRIGARAADGVDPAGESGFVQRINQERTNRGLPPLAVADDLVAIARNHSQEMASQNNLHHNARLAEDVHGWIAVGENVGTGPSVQDVHVAFMNSPHHRDNIVNSRFTQVGLGVVWAGRQLWV